MVIYLSDNPYTNWLIIILEVHLCTTPKAKQPSVYYNCTVSKLYKTSFDALSVAVPIDITKNMFYTARAVDETVVSSCKMEDYQHLVGVTKDSRMKPEWKSRNGFKWPWNYYKSCLNMNVLNVQIFSFSADL